MSEPINPTATAGYTITTPRIIMRTTIPSDGEGLLAFINHPKNNTFNEILTLEALLERIDKWTTKTAEGESAFMIFVHRETGQVLGFGGFNTLPRTPMLNSAYRRGDTSIPEEDKVLVGDIGVSIDYRFQRQGYAREAVCGMAEFGFETFKCGYIHLDTSPNNEALRGLMRDMGIPEKKGSGEEHEDNVMKYAWKSLNYDFDRDIWAGVKTNLKENGKWPL